MIKSASIAANGRGYIMQVAGVVAGRTTLVALFVPTRSKDAAWVRAEAAKRWEAGGYAARIAPLPTDGWVGLSWEGA